MADLRQVNLKLKDDLMELPNINHILDKVGDRNLYSTLDLSKSFHQVPYSEESRFITSFLYKNKQYQFARMVMGLKNSSASFTRMVMTLINGLGISDSLAYFIDDLIIFTRDVRSHIQVLGLLFQRLQWGNLKLTPRKCHFLREEVEYVGITLTKDGVKMNDSRIQHIKDLKPPTNRAELQSVLGMLNYSKKFCRGYSDIARPLYALLRKKAQFVWTPECEESFQKLRESLITSPVLAFPSHLPSVLATVPLPTFSPGSHNGVNTTYTPHFPGLLTSHLPSVLATVPLPTFSPGSHNGVNTTYTPHFPGLLTSHLLRPGCIEA